MAKKLPVAEAMALVEKYVDEARKKLAKACEVADRNGINFDWPGPEDSYGMSGSYTPADLDWEPSACEWEESNPNPIGTWSPDSE